MIVYKNYVCDCSLKSLVLTVYIANDWQVIVGDYSRRKFTKDFAHE